MNLSNAFASPALGNALHQALAQCHRDWHYEEAIPDVGWIQQCWEQNSEGLSPVQQQEGRQMLETYYEKFIAGEVALHELLAVEGKIQATLRIENVEFQITGRYDRIDYLPAG